MNVTSNVTTTAAPRTRPLSWIAALCCGAAVAIGLGVYGRTHQSGSETPYTLGFSSVLPMKAWLATGVLALAVFQLGSAVWMYGRLPGIGAAPGWVSGAHRWSGTAAFVVSLPVAFACLWSLGFSASDGRTLAHSVAGCLFYGAYAAKMIGLRLSGAPRWAIPVLGATAFTVIVLLWLTSALWLFTTPGLAKI